MMWDGVLLVGPTGSGKTPLGNLLEGYGLAGRPCVHFDFGAQLREVAQGGPAAALLSPEEIAFVRRVLDSGALLEDDQFPLAERILRAFLARRDPRGEALVVLNGLPRHLGQARGVSAVVRVRAVIWLECRTEVVRERLRSDVGGDRVGRPDDQPDAVEHKLALFASQTAPLVDYYRDRGVPVYRIEVAATMTSHHMYNLVATLAHAPGGWFTARPEV